MMLDLADHLRPWHELPVCVIDFETTGVDPAECAPVEIAVVRFEKRQPVGHWSTLLNPGTPIPEEAAAIHGITDEAVADAPPVDAMIPVVRDNAEHLMQNAVPCGYNGDAFDRLIMQRYVCEGGILPVHDDWPWLDPLVVIRHIDRYVKGKGRHKLATTCERHGVALPEAHRALGDAEATGRLLYSDAIMGALGDQTISEVLRRQRIRAAEQDKRFQEWLAKQPPLDDAQAGGA